MGKQSGSDQTEVVSDGWCIHMHLQRIWKIILGLIRLKLFEMDDVYTYVYQGFGKSFPGLISWMTCTIIVYKGLVEAQVFCIGQIEHGVPVYWECTMIACK